MQNTDPVSLTYGQLTDLVERVEQMLPLTGVNPPTPSTPAFYVGQLYYSTASHRLYICTARNTSTYTWEELASKSYVDGLIGDIDTALDVLLNGEGS